MTVEQRHDSERKLLGLRLALAVAIVALLTWIGFSLFESNQRAATSEANEQVAKSNSQTLAEDIKRICAEEGKVLLDDRDLCAKAERVQATPTEAIPGPKGDKGNDGERGPIGPIGPVGATGPKGDMGPIGPVGPKGDKGDRGDDGLAGLTVEGPAGTDGTMGPMGPAGPAGVPGKDGAPGPVGPAGPAGADGAPGAQGPRGEPGRGVADTQCGADGRWTVTYTDGTTQDGGVCRVDNTPPAPPGPPVIGVLP